MHAVAVLENEVKSRWKGIVGKVAIQQWRNKAYFGDSKQPSFDDSEKHGGMRVSGRMEVSVKFSEKPRSTLAEDGKVQIEIECNGKTIRVGLKPKSWRKAAALMDQYPLWVACVSGKMGAMDAAGMELEGAGIQVFEKQAKSGGGS